MKNFVYITILAGTLLSASVPAAFAQEVDTGMGERQKLAQTGMKFLSVSVDARAAAMADAMTAQEGSSISMFYNPAGMAHMENFVHASGGQVSWIADIRFDAASVAFRPAGGAFGVFGVSIIAADYGDLIGTIRADNDRGYQDVGDFSPSAMSVGLGYAKALTDRFSVGGNVKYVRESLGASVMRVDASGMETKDFAKSAPAFDFGILYRTGVRSVNFAMSVRNFAQELTYAEESFELPLTFRVGISMDLMDLTSVNREMHAFRMAVEAVRPRDFSEHVQVGGEYLFMNTLALRAGYAFPLDEQGVNLGGGLQREISGIGFGFNYAYTNFGTFGAVNRLGLQLSL